MTNENEFEIAFRTDDIAADYLTFEKNKDGTYAQGLTRIQFKAFKKGCESKQSRIDLLESAIREFLKSTDEVFFDNFPDILKAEETLRNLMENKS